MTTLYFDRRKYGRELLIDAASIDELVIVDEKIILSFYSIFFVENGEGSYKVDTEKFTLNAHQVLFIKPGQINDVAQIKFHAGNFIFFEDAFLDEFFNDPNFLYKFAFFHDSTLPSYLKLPENKFFKYNNVVKEIWNELKKLSPDSPHILRSSIYYLLTKLNRLYGEAYSTRTGILTESKLLQFLKLLDQHIQNEHQVQYYADNLQISRVSLNQLCQKHFGKTSNQIIRERLLSEVKKQIKYTEKDLAEIAYDFHFSAPAHMSRFFKQMTGLAPMEFRADLSNW